MASKDRISFWGLFYEKKSKCALGPQIWHWGEFSCDGWRVTLIPYGKRCNAP